MIAIVTPAARSVERAPPTMRERHEQGEEQEHRGECDHERGQEHAEVVRDALGEEAPGRRVRLAEHAVGAREQERQDQVLEHEQPDREEGLALERQHELERVEHRVPGAREPDRRVPDAVAEGLEEH